MAIEFVTEDGTGIANATSYGTVAGFRQYRENHGASYDAVTDDVVKTHLNAATEYLDDLYPWRGIKERTTQALQFPRHSCYDDDGQLQSGVPGAIVRGVYIAAGHLADGNDLMIPTENVRSKTMGPISVVYGAAGEQPVRLPQLERAIAGLVQAVGVMR